MPKSNPTEPYSPAPPKASIQRPWGVSAQQPSANRRSSVTRYNPATGAQDRQDAAHSTITVFDYDSHGCTENTYSSVEEVLHFRDTDSVTWINIEGLIRQEVLILADHFQIHQLTVDDILSQGQRAKMDEFGDMIFCLLPMLVYQSREDTIAREQVSLILTKHVVLSFQESVDPDAFNPVRDKLEAPHSRLRSGGTDALYNALLDAIVDQYFVAMESLALKIEQEEDMIMKSPNKRSLVRINYLRREVSAVRRSIIPVRELINGILKTESALIQKKTKTYFKDIYDHIIQANETADGYRDLIVSLQDLYLSQMNLRMNEVMKLLAVVTALFAPLTLITGIYGMNFVNMPELHTRYGYFVVLGVMLLLVIMMLHLFKKRGWF
jgi:magnesium transporter